MASDRFEHLEGPQGLPDNVRDALKRLDRFEHLEIGAQPPAAKAPAPKSAPQRLCPRCAQPNEPERSTCWACYQSFIKESRAKREPDDITLVLDGTTYKSTDKDLPDDVAELMRRIREDGYSEKLLGEWRSWRATRRSPRPVERPFDQETRGEDEERDIKVFKGQRISVIRLDGKVYTSDDPTLSPEMKELFAYIDREGVTPELMETLRQRGEVKLRPPTTAMPSDGDVAFWKEVSGAHPNLSPEPQPAPAPDENRSTMLFLAVAAAVYVAIRVLSC